MAKESIRVYELAKELNTTSKIIMDELAEKNIIIKNHMSLLKEFEYQAILKHFGKEDFRSKDNTGRNVEENIICLVKKNDIEEEINNIRRSSKPTKFQMQLDFPYNNLDGSVFELLLYSAFNTNRKITQLKVDYDLCRLAANGAGDKGRDVVLFNKKKLVCVIQCKRHKANLDRSSVGKEIIKFILHCIQDSYENIDYSNFTYCFAVSTGLNNEANNLIENFNTQIENEKDLEKWTKDVINEYKQIKVQYDLILPELKEILSKIKVGTLLPIDITNIIKNNSDLIATFFEVEKVIDIKSFEDLIYGTNLNIESFLNTYKNNVINNLIRVNFFGLSVHKKPREAHLYTLFTEPSLSSEGNSFFDNTFYHTENITNKAISKSYITFNEDIEKLFLLPQLIHNINESLKIKDDELIRKMYNTLVISTEQKSINKNIKFSELFNGNKNMVILGKPGAGKSSLVKYSICKLLDKDLKVFENKSIYEYIPFRIELSKYNREKTEINIGLVEHISKILDQEYQVSFISKKALDELFKKYNTIVFFDGLDEVLDVQQRLAIRNDVENFSRNYPKARTIITSRYESYKEVYFADKDFNILEVNNFDDDQISYYVNRWYSIEENDEKIRQKEITNFLKELDKIEDELKRNPLLLTLILILFRNEQELPTSKLDIYENCTNTLVDTRDSKEKQLGIKLTIKNKIATFASLAYWQFTSQDNNKDVIITYELVINHITEYLMKKGEFKKENEADAKVAAAEFLEFAKIRSIYIDDCFTHKTFQEYFTAYYIFANYHSKGNFTERDRIISSYIGKSSWQVILELLITKIDKDQLDFEVIEGIFEKQYKINKNDTLIFFLKVIKYIRNVSEDMNYQLIIESIKTCIYENSNDTKLLNEYLLNLSKLDRFKSNIRTALDKVSEDIKTNNELHNFILFVLENNIDFDKVPNNFNNESYKLSIEQDPYLFILFYHTLLDDLEKFSELLKIFINKFGKKEVTKFYYSKFGRNIFNGKSKFSWIIDPLFFTEDYEIFVKVYKILNKYGLYYSDINKAINKDSGKITTSEEKLIEYFNKTQSLSIKRVISIALEKYYNKIFPIMEENKPKYNPSNRKQRRFPIPK